MLAVSSGLSRVLGLVWGGSFAPNLGDLIFVILCKFLNYDHYLFAVVLGYRVKDMG
jgi:hypothetical protein